MQFVPSSRPQQTRERTAELLPALSRPYPVRLLGIRGYYLDSMGERGRNDRRMYDDAIILVSPTVHLAFNANTDPAAFRPGIATLQCGTWLYKLGIHGLSKPRSQQYEALVQAKPVMVLRDERGYDTGWFGINIHRGSRLSTSSLGCQTIWPGQWGEFIDAVRAQMGVYGQTVIPYTLIEQAA